MTVLDVLDWLISIALVALVVYGAIVAVAWLVA
jgi:hypothetical protein